MTITARVIIGVLSAFIIGGSAYVLWFVKAESADRRKHYLISITIKPNGNLGVYKSKWVDMGKKAITVVPRVDTPIADIDINLFDGSATVTDARPPHSEWRDR